MVIYQAWHLMHSGYKATLVLTQKYILYLYWDIRREQEKELFSGKKKQILFLVSVCETDEFESGCSGSNLLDRGDKVHSGCQPRATVSGLSWRHRYTVTRPMKENGWANQRKIAQHTEKRIGLFETTILFDTSHCQHERLVYIVKRQHLPSREMSSMPAEVDDDYVIRSRSTW